MQPGNVCLMRLFFFDQCHPGSAYWFILIHELVWHIINDLLELCRHQLSQRKSMISFGINSMVCWLLAHVSSSPIIPVAVSGGWKPLLSHLGGGSVGRSRSQGVVEWDLPWNTSGFSTSTINHGRFDQWNTQVLCFFFWKQWKTHVLARERERVQRESCDLTI